MPNESNEAARNCAFAGGQRSGDSRRRGGSMTAVLLIDFGSTWTKLRAFDLDSRTLMAATQGPSTVATDINVGLDIALARLREQLGGMPAFGCRLASSSAAGGLRMVTIGLVRELTAAAARQAALGAGAKLCGSFAH